MLSDFLSDFYWRRPLEDRWSEHVAGLRAAIDDEAFDGPAIARRAQQLANQRLGPMEQMKVARLAAKLWPIRARLDVLRPFRIAILSDANIDLLATDLRAAGLARGLLIEPVLAPFGTAAAVASGALAMAGGGHFDGALFVPDASSLPLHGPLLDEDDETQRLDHAEARIKSVASGLRSVLKAPVIVATMAGRAEYALASANLALPGTPERFISRLNARIADAARTRSFDMWNLAGLAARVGYDRWFDPVRYHHGKFPFAVEATPLAADHLAGLIAAMTGKAGRALILDLDNTIWGGVIGDDGVEGIALGQGSPAGEAFLEIQRMALDLRARGIVLAVCSKNNDDVARRAVAEHPEMLLRHDDIAVFTANWNDKATNIREIARSLDLGLESMVFVDDNPVERAWVREALPEVIVPEMGSDPALYPRIIVASGAFEHLPLNSDDLVRASSYRARAQREQLIAESSDYDGYLRSLDMQMKVMSFDTTGRTRIAQLINKSNQFNLTTRRYSEAMVEELQNDPGFLCWQVRLADRFTDQGMIACVVAETSAAGTWRIDTWLMSCRVLERGVEQAIMNLLVDRARSAGADAISGEYIPTNRNQLVAEFYDRMKFELVEVEAGTGIKRYLLRVADFLPFQTAIDVSVQD